MMMSPEHVRAVDSSTGTLTDAAIEAVRDAILVIDARSDRLPLTLINAAARRCFAFEPVETSLAGRSLWSVLSDDMIGPVELAMASLMSGAPSVVKTIGWRLASRTVFLPTEFKRLQSGARERLVSLAFASPAAARAAALSLEPRRDLPRAGSPAAALTSKDRRPAPGRLVRDQSLALPALGEGLLAAIVTLPMNVLILDRSLAVTFANASAAEAAGATPDALLGQPPFTLIPTSAVPRDAFTAALYGQHYHHVAIAVPAPQGGMRWFEVDVQPLRDVQGIIAGLAVLSTEMTEWDVRQRAARGSERRLQAVTEQARDIVKVAAADGTLRYVSGGITQVLGHRPTERLSNSLFDLVHPEDVEELRARYQALADGRVSQFTHQYRARHKEGSYRWLESSFVAALDSRLLGGIVINARDVTDRKQAESRLAQREEAFKLAADAVLGVLFEWDLAAGTVHRSRGVRDLLGVDPVDVAPVAAWSRRIHPKDLEAYEASVAAAIADGTGWTTSYRIRSQTGCYRSVLERGLVQRDEEGRAVGVIGCCVDVSDIKRLTDLLAETHRVARMGAWELNYASGELAWTDEVYRLFETTPDAFVVTWETMLAQCPLESRRALTEARAAAESGSGEMDLELEINTLAQRRRWVRLVGHVEMLDGRPFRAAGSIQDIQARKVAQLALENGTAWLKLSLDMAHMHAWRWDRASDTLQFANADGSMVNLPKLYPGLSKLLSRVHPQDRLAVREGMEQAFARCAEVRGEFRLRMPDGTYRAFAAVARPLLDSTHSPIGLVGVTQDVTERHEAEARLRCSEELLRATTANTADTLVLVDAELRIRFINRAIFGRSIESLVGCDIAVLLPPAAASRVLQRLRAVLVSGGTATYEFAVEGASQIEHYENRAVLVRDAEVGAGLSIAMRNITHRKRLEREILEVSSRERQTIGRDLHDGLGQELTGVALMLRGLATRLEASNPEVVADVNEIVQVVNQSIEAARALARGLLPVDNEHGGLPAALRALALRTRDRYGLTVEFRANVSTPVPLPDAAASHLYRIAQEALTNTARHAGATRVAVFLLISANKFILRITDDGIGTLAAVSTGSGMGLKIMKYRAGMIGARLEISAHQPHGTVVRVIGPHPAVTGQLQSVQAI